MPERVADTGAMQRHNWSQITTAAATERDCCSIKYVKRCSYVVHASKRAESPTERSYYDFSDFRFDFPAHSDEEHVCSSCACSAPDAARQS